MLRSKKLSIVNFMYIMIGNNIDLLFLLNGCLEVCDLKAFYVWPTQTMSHWSLSILITHYIVLFI